MAEDRDRNAYHVQSYYDGRARLPEANSLQYRSQTRIYHLRNFNNWIKSCLLASYLKQRLARQAAPHDKHVVNVLDFCCGKGGDQLKFREARVDHVTFVDISRDSVDVARQRYNRLVDQAGRNRIFTADFQTLDCTTQAFGLHKTGPENGGPCDALTESPMLYHLVNCQFALHYAFESVAQARTMLSNISANLVEGGFLLATIPNAYEIVRRARAALSDPAPASTPADDVDGITFGNSVFSVHFPASSYTLDDGGQPEFPLLGARYNFRLEEAVDCPEYLVYPDLLVALAKEVGLEVDLDFTPFSDLLASSQCVQADPDLMIRMKALERMTIDSDGCLQLSSYPEKGYRHVVDWLDASEDSSTTRCVGTLSKDEWDMITLYSAVAFQKRTPSEKSDNSG